MGEKGKGGEREGKEREEREGKGWGEEENFGAFPHSKFATTPLYI